MHGSFLVIIADDFLYFFWYNIKILNYSPSGKEMIMAYYGTQGGGIAEERGDTLVWREPPGDFPEMQLGEPIPEEWSVVGPFDDETNKPFIPNDSEFYF